MTQQIALHHRTRYTYDRPVRLSPHVVRLRPAPHTRTPLLAYSLKIEPATHFLNWQQDPYGNYLARLVFPEKASELVVEVDLLAEMTAVNPFDFFVEGYAEAWPFVYPEALRHELAPYLAPQPPGPHLAQWLAPWRDHAGRTVDFLVALDRALHDDIRYLIRQEPGVQTCEETLALRSGSCRDSAWLLVQILRNLGLAARFVSGYLIQLVADVKPLDGPEGPTADFTDLHAWAEVYVPGAGWIGLDPTSGLLAGEGHIPLACAAEPTSAAPVTGTIGLDGEPPTTRFEVEMSVSRIFESPRVTLPYTEAQWAAIHALGREVDARLDEGDVRLTMGGEPTFVSIDDMDGAEWTVAALGPRKRQLAETLVRRLRERFAPGGLLQYGQGKWYPGEPLPRWALTCLWRRDGVSLWDDATLLADRDLGHDAASAERFVHALAARLGVAASNARPAFEDAFYYLWRERRLPFDVDPRDPKLDDPLERDRLARIFEQGTGAVVGWALPLRDAAPGQWASGAWTLRGDHLYLLPGDSPMGLRLPIESLPWTPPAERPQVTPPDPFAPRSPLPPRLGGTHAPSGPLQGVRTALCVEPRDGRLHVFLPPLSTLESFVDLVNALETTAASLGLPVVVEGYPPPRDHRIGQIQVTPDPGVIEVNVHPSASWDDLVHTTETLYEEARQVRLGTEKFMLDGRHTGTGGGNHITLGGPTPADSPLLRRPDLLASMIAYWHNHPSLSYLFSGLFIGPTSQSPRADEGRPDMLHELEIALSQLQAEPAPPWLVDRVLRHLLVDVSGNTHRTEFCIDKLYAPDSASGRQGLVELRAFEMPPHARMSLAEQLLVRALVARFWAQPYRARLVRWGSSLHDRFMLPHFVAADMHDVIDETRRAGIAFDEAWLAPHLAFRFPVHGTATCRDVVLELRQALEPWYVLGEEAAGGGTVRAVDSSVERLQVKARGLIEGRHVVTCNGRRVPLFPSEVNGEAVAGVRYRAWRPPSCLHPTVPVHSPLVFDVVDTWSGRSLGGCTYHVSHPGGRAHEVFPVNAREAEARRLARFAPFGHTPGPLTPSADEPTRQLPLTLDLRWTPS